MPKTRRVLVTGAAGFLGYYIVEELLGKGDHVVAIDLKEIDIDHRNLEKIYMSVRDGDRLSELMQNIQEVYHLAAIADIAESRKDPVETIDINVLGTAKCLEAARKARVKRFIFASSVYVGGNMGSFYGVSKRLGEMLCKTFCEEYGLDYTICRYGSLYGRRANQWNMVHKLCRTILAKRKYEFWGSGEEVREFIHIKDASKETVRVARDQNFSNKAVLITGHQKMKINEFFSMVGEIVDKKDLVIYKSKQNHSHYKMTPYCFASEIPIRINMQSFIDISEGILDCLKEADEEMHS